MVDKEAFYGAMRDFLEPAIDQVFLRNITLAEGILSNFK